jgi:hypothetical protein
VWREKRPEQVDSSEEIVGEFWFRQLAK